MKLEELIQEINKKGGLSSFRVCVQVKDDTNSFIVDDVKIDNENCVILLDVKEVTYWHWITSMLLLKRGGEVMKESTQKAYDSLVSRLKGENYQITPNDLTELDTIVNGLSTDYDNAVESLNKSEQQINQLKQDNWDLYNKIPRGTSNSNTDNNSQNYTVEDLFK